DEKRPVEGRRIRLRVAAAAVAGLAVMAACTGDNLFTGPSLGGTLLGPSVEIEAPAANAVVGATDSVQVRTTVASENGVTQVTLSGVFPTGTAAYISQVVSLPNPQDTTISRFLKRSGTATGSARIIVQATDLLGGTAADTVTITINP
ncbi:MAG: hypothetical protein OEN00_11665, partial [Gemmatimonadota bacterium]|nr:hypothetical protein [Gemmatimonadota bacterium]